MECLNWLAEPWCKSYDLKYVFINIEKRNSSRDEDTAWTTAACLSYWDEKDFKKSVMPVSSTDPNKTKPSY